MPGLNRRGPNDDGPMTGRKMGRCNRENKGRTDDEIIQSRVSSLEPGQGTGRGFGRGRGLGKGMEMRFRGNV